MLKNAALIVKIGFDTAENEPQKEGCVVATTRVRYPFGEGGRRRAAPAEDATRLLTPRDRRSVAVELPSPPPHDT